MQNCHVEESVETQGLFSEFKAGLQSQATSISLSRFKIAFDMEIWQKFLKS